MSTDDRGMVTAETAVVAPFVVAVLVAAAWLVSLGTVQSRSYAAAVEVARQVSRGESVDVARRAGERIAPEGARFRVTSGEGTVVVRVETMSRAPVFNGVAKRVVASASMQLEEGES